MSLVKDTLINGLRKFMDQDYTPFAGFPQTKEDAITVLAGAVNDYASLITPVSTTASAAKTAMESALVGMSEDGAAPDKIKNALAVYALTIAGGMLPTYTATSIPNASTISFDSITPGPDSTDSSQVVATKLADIIDAWFKTGMSQLTATPNTPQPWI